jgi:hypothetical protein
MYHHLLLAVAGAVITDEPARVVLDRNTSVIAETSSAFPKIGASLIDCL